MKTLFKISVLLFCGAILVPVMFIGLGAEIALAKIQNWAFDIRR